MSQNPIPPNPENQPEILPEDILAEALEQSETGQDAADILAGFEAQTDWLGPLLAVVQDTRTLSDAVPVPDSSASLAAFLAQAEGMATGDDAAAGGLVGLIRGSPLLLAATLLGLLTTLALLCVLVRQTTGQPVFSPASTETASTGTASLSTASQTEAIGAAMTPTGTPTSSPTETQTPLPTATNTVEPPPGPTITPSDAAATDAAATNAGGTGGQSNAATGATATPSPTQPATATSETKTSPTSQAAQPTTEAEADISGQANENDDTGSPDESQTDTPSSLPKAGGELAAYWLILGVGMMLVALGLSLRSWRLEIGRFFCSKRV